MVALRRIVRVMIFATALLGLSHVAVGQGAPGGELRRERR